MTKPDDPHKERDAKIRAELRASGMAFIRTLLTFSDTKEATKMVKEHATNDLDKAYAGEVQAVTLDCDELDERASHTGKHLKETEQQERNTKSYVKVADVRGSGESKDAPFPLWSLKDKIVFPLLIVLMVLVLGAGSANVFSAIMAQGEVIFLETPILAIFLSFLLPAGSASIHFLGDLLESDRSRHRYMLTILGLNASALFAWTGLFAMNFQIGAVEIDFNALGEASDPTATVFTFVQLLTEMLCGASLSLGAMHIHSRYSGESTVRNPESDALEREIKKHLPEHEANHEGRKKARGRRMQIKAIREVHISEQVALFIAMRKRFDDSSPV